VPLPDWFWGWARWYLHRSEFRNEPVRSLETRPTSAPGEFPSGRGQGSRRCSSDEVSSHCLWVPAQSRQAGVDGHKNARRNHPASFVTYEMKCAASRPANRPLELVTDLPQEFFANLHVLVGFHPDR
jgi:hypothetical protein